MSLSVDASNPCVPPTSNLSSQCPPLPRTIERGIPLPLHGNPGRINNSPDSPPLLLYPSKHSVVLLNLATGTSFVYRGHTANVTVARFSPSGAYIASADVKGKLRVWSFDNEEHLCKLDITALSGPIRDLAWDFESKRIAVVGEGSPSDPSSVCTRVIQWDTGVKIGDLGQHSRKKASSVSFKPNRPMRVVTGGSEDFKVIMNKGPPFQRIAPQEEDGEIVPMENAHQKGSVHCVRYNHDGSILASAGTDKAVVFYDGKTMKMIKKLDNVHTASIYSCAFNHDGTKLLTCAADGTAKLITLNGFEITNTWDVADYLKQGHENGIKKVPLGCMLMGCAFVLQNGGSEDVPVVVGMNGNICTLSEDSNSVISVITGHQAPISSMTIDHDKNMMYTTDSDGVIVQWDVSDSTLVKAVTNLQRDTNTEEGFDETVMNKVHPGAITGITHTSSSILSIGWDDNVRISTDSSMKLKFKLNAQPNAIAKGTELVTIMTVRGLQIMKDDELVSEISLPYEATSICVAKSDDVMYVGGNDSNTIHIYKINHDDYSIEEIHQISGIHAKPVYSLALSNDGSKLASADDKDICVWDAESGSYAPIVGKGRWCFHRQRINALAWSKDDSVLASGANDDSIYFWSVNKKTTRVHYPHSHRGGVVAMEFLKSATGHVLISVGNDACVNRWDVTDDVAKKFNSN